MCLLVQTFAARVTGCTLLCGPSSIFKLFAGLREKPFQIEIRESKAWNQIQRCGRQEGSSWRYDVLNGKKKCAAVILITNPFYRVSQNLPKQGAYSASGLKTGEVNVASFIAAVWEITEEL